MDIKYQSIFAQIKESHATGSTELNRNKNSDILLVDGTLNFIRNWIVVPTLSSNGDHVGGTSGFLMSIGHAIKLLRPTRVIIVFDGKGGSLRRKQLYPEYKNKRTVPVRVNRAYEDIGDPELEHRSMLEQMGKLIDFLRCLPVSVTAIDYI